ncbi:MAG: lipoprotein [Phycisphaerales bacterium]|nr:lipoprotein [Hyphomonadaceae bacterium]
MMRRVLMAAVAALALSACNQDGAGGPGLPRLQEGAQAPATMTPAVGVQQAQITDEVRQQLIANIGEQLDAVQQNFAAGMTPPEGFTDEVVAMQPSTDHRFVMGLTGNTPYTFIAVCDGDCTNVDLELIDMRTGGVVDSDVLPDDYPVVAFSPPANGDYMVRVLMQNCTVAPCYAGARALMQGPAAAAGPK